MPTRPYTKLERVNAEFLVDIADVVDTDDTSDSSDESLADALMDEAVEPFMRRRLLARDWA